MLDEDFKVYLIEVNTNPCIETNSPLLSRLIPDMIDSGLRMALDPLYPPPSMSKRMNLTLPTVNLWHLSFDETIDGPEIEASKQNRPQSLQESEKRNVIDTDFAGETEDKQDA